MADRVEVDEQLSRAIIVYSGIELGKMFPSRNRYRLDEEFGEELATELWEAMTPVTYSFGQDFHIVTREDVDIQIARAKELSQQKSKGGRIPDEQLEAIWAGPSAPDPFWYLARDRFVSGEETERQVERAKAECRERFPQISDEAVEALGWIYRYQINRNLYGRI